MEPDAVVASESPLHSHQPSPSAAEAQMLVKAVKMLLNKCRHSSCQVRNSGTCTAAILAAPWGCLQYVRGQRERRKAEYGKINITANRHYERVTEQVY